MAATEVTTTRPGLAARAVAYYREVVAEMKKVTWPDQGQLKQMTIQILVFVLVIGAVIALLDLLLQTTLIRLPQSLLR
jgi:preprotein translocase subunit SecE